MNWCLKCPSLLAVAQLHASLLWPDLPSRQEEANTKGPEKDPREDCWNSFSVLAPGLLQSSFVLVYAIVSIQS